MLVLMNLNGVLLYRTKDPIVFKRPKGVKHYGPKAWIRIFFDDENRTRCYFREGHMEFLNTLMKHPRIKLGFYSSMQRKNMDGILDFMWREDSGLPMEKDIVVFDQTYNRKSESK